MSAPQPRKVLHLPKVRMLSRGGRLSSGIRITNVRSIRPANPEAVKKLEEEKLRAQLQKEIVSRSRMCSYAGYECWSPVTSGRRYCAAHALCEPGAPFVQCGHTYGNGERCPHPAPAPPPDQREGKETGQCFEHARAALLARQRSTAPPPPVISTETLLNQLQHYVKPERPRTTSCASSVSVVSDPAEPEQASPIAVDPFKQMDATAINTAHSFSILECASGSESEGESVTLGPDGNCRYTRPASDTEDAPTEDTPLWRAGVFTAEEAVSETKKALRSLQSAYIRQMARLKVLLQTARLQYLKSLKQEKEQYCSINSQARSGPLSVRERRQLRKLKAYAGYHTKHGVEAVLARKLQQKRAKVLAPAPARPLPPPARCVHALGGVRCARRSLPAARHCDLHILHDGHQVLFRACGDPRGAGACAEPVARLPLPSAACRYHTGAPLYKTFTLKKDNSDTETDTDTPATDSMTEDVEQPIEHTLEHTLEEQLEETLEQQLEETLEQQLEDTLEQQLGDTLEQQLGDTLGQQLGDTLGQQLGDTLEQTLEDTLEPSIGESMYT